MDLGGTRQLIALTQAKLVGLDVATGALLWERPFVSSNFTNSATPILAGQTVIVSNGGPVTAVTVTKRDGKWTTEEAWTNADQPYRLSNPVLVGDTLFGLSTRNSGQYFAVDVKTGKSAVDLRTASGRPGGGGEGRQIVFSLEDDGELVVGRVGTTAFEPLRRYKVADSETWTQPTISGKPALREGRVDADPLDAAITAHFGAHPARRRRRDHEGGVTANDVRTSPTAAPASAGACAETQTCPGR